MQIKLAIVSLAALAVANPLPAPAALPEVEQDVVVARDTQTWQAPHANTINQWRQSAGQYARSHVNQGASYTQINQARKWWDGHWNNDWDNGRWDSNLWQWYWLYSSQSNYRGWFDNQKWWNTCQRRCNDVWSNNFWY